MTVPSTRVLMVAKLLLASLAVGLPSTFSVPLETEPNGTWPEPGSHLSYRVQVREGTPDLRYTRGQDLTVNLTYDGKHWRGRCEGTSFLDTPFTYEQGSIGKNLAMKRPIGGPRTPQAGALLNHTFFADDCAIHDVTFELVGLQPTRNHILGEDGERMHVLAWHARAPDDRRREPHYYNDEIRWDPDTGAAFYWLRSYLTGEEVAGLSIYYHLEGALLGTDRPWSVLGWPKDGSFLVYETHEDYVFSDSGTRDGYLLVLRFDYQDGEWARRCTGTVQRHNGPYHIHSPVFLGDGQDPFANATLPEPYVDSWPVTTMGYGYVGLEEGQNVSVPLISRCFMYNHDLNLVAKGPHSYQPTLDDPVAAYLATQVAGDWPQGGHVFQNRSWAQTASVLLEYDLHAWKHERLVPGPNETYTYETGWGEIRLRGRLVDTDAPLQ